MSVKNLLLAFVFTVLSWSQGQQLSADGLCVWTSVSGQSSPPAALHRYDKRSGQVYFRGVEGKKYRTSFNALAHTDQKKVNATAVHFVTTSAQMPLGESQPSDDFPPLKYGTPRESATDPITIITSRTVKEEVKVPIRKKVRRAERFGLFGRRCRIVYRTIKTMRSEIKMRTVQESRSILSLLSDPSSKEVKALITLDAPRSAGAISTQIRDVLDALFPPDKFVFNRTLNDSVVDYQQTTPVDGLSLQIRVEIQRDPRQVNLHAVSVDVNNLANAETEAKKLFVNVSAALTN